ncbi:hypothetical protein QTP70_014290 [Hemibagrus guttatus]|uniref:[histone H3]-lysine(4) N-trimethyltransferase n=1 Tax=Hemibagrus guttatus TaxID=175788 RepID=A0AAE0PR73_9TELE|nr:hypothetical protein QTP70_014290 [Hemibagrus guttatus]
MHKLECSAMCSFGESWCPSETVRLVARVISRMKVQKEPSASEKLLLLKDLEANLDKLDNEKKEMNEADIAELHHFYSKHLDFPDHQSLLTLFAQPSHQAVASELELDDLDGQNGRKGGVDKPKAQNVLMAVSCFTFTHTHTQVHCNGFTVEDEELSHVGSALFPDVALMNHSCCPNVIVTYRGTLAEVRAVKDISPGDEIFTSYIDLLYPTEDRIERLRDSYYFTCDCKECITKSKDNVKLKLRKVKGEEPRSEEVREMLRYARNAIEDFRRAKQEKNILSPPAELLEMCELSMDKMGSMFEDTNVYMLHMMYQAMGVCMYMEDYDGAVNYGEKVIKPFRQLYPAYSLNVASMYLKLGRLYMALDRTSAGSTALKKDLGYGKYGVCGPLLRAVRSLYDRSMSLVRIAGYDVILLAPSSLDLQHALGRFAAECKAAGLRVSTSKSEAMVLDRKKVVCPLQVGGELLPQVEEFKYLGVLFTSEGRMEREIDRWIGAAAAVMRFMYQSVVVKKELSRKVKLSIYQSIYVPTWS